MVGLRQNDSVLFDHLLSREPRHSQIYNEENLLKSKPCDKMLRPIKNTLEKLA